MWWYDFGYVFPSLEFLEFKELAHNDHAFPDIFRFGKKVQAFCFCVNVAIQFKEKLKCKNK